MHNIPEFTASTAYVLALVVTLQESISGLCIKMSAYSHVVDDHDAMSATTSSG